MGKWKSGGNPSLVTSIGRVDSRCRWMAGGKCLDEDPELFFPVGESDPQWEDAIAVCNKCPVQHECLQYALDNRMNYGVWGGTTEIERRQMLRRREPARMKAAT